MDNRCTVQSVKSTSGKKGMKLSKVVYVEGSPNRSTSRSSPRVSQERRWRRIQETRMKGCTTREAWMSVRAPCMKWGGNWLFSRTREYASLEVVQEDVERATGFFR